MLALPDQPPGSATTRRRLAAGALLAFPAVITRPALAARAAHSVTIAGVGGWFRTDFDTIVLGTFRKSHPDIAVFYYRVGNSYQALALLRGQRAFPTTDVALLETGMAASATKEGLLVP
jgi:hypothetical protein